MQLASKIFKKSEIDNLAMLGYAHPIDVPFHALDVEITETEDDLIVSYLLPERGEVVPNMGNC